KSKKSHEDCQQSSPRNNMPKLKTRKSISKRFKITKSGKILRRPSGQDHGLKANKPKKRRALRKFIPLSKPEAKVIKRALKG
ncbi:MAG: 50S ribosomal protein L35, partial [archaeon]|nr:50S ribosomal protein L35 [archaeon]